MLINSFDVSDPANRAKVDWYKKRLTEAKINDIARVLFDPDRSLTGGAVMDGKKEHSFIFDHKNPVKIRIIELLPDGFSSRLSVMFEISPRLIQSRDLKSSKFVFEIVSSDKKYFADPGNINSAGSIMPGLIDINVFENDDVIITDTCKKVYAPSNLKLSKKLKIIRKVIEGRRDITIGDELHPRFERKPFPKAVGNGLLPNVGFSITLPILLKSGSN